MKFAKRILALTLITFPMMALAQLTPEQKVTANIPFEFTVANKVVPAGQWSAQRAPLSTRTLLIRSGDARIGLTAFTLPGESKMEPRNCALIFTRYGDRYFLSGVKVEGSREIYRIPENKAEAELRSENRQASEEVIVASLK